MGSSPPNASPVPIAFTYTYARQPPGCCGGYYDDPGNTILSDGVKPSSITRSNCVEFDLSSHAYQPTIDLGEEYAVNSLELSYVAAPSWGKYAPSKVAVSCLSASVPLPQATSSVEFSDLSNSGGHTVSVDLTRCERVRYITLEQVKPSRGHTNVGELVVLGWKHSSPPPPPLPYPPRPPSPPCDSYSAVRYVCSSNDGSGYHGFTGSYRTYLGRPGSSAACRALCEAQSEAGCCEWRSTNHCNWKRNARLFYSAGHTDTTSFLCSVAPPPPSPNPPPPFDTAASLSMEPPAILLLLIPLALGALLAMLLGCCIIREARSLEHVLLRLIAGAALAVIVYSYEVALYFGAALEYRGALDYSSFVAALSSSVELVAALSLARSGRRARTSTAALYLMAGAASGLALAAVVIFSHLPAGYLSDVVEPGAALCLTCSALVLAYYASTQSRCCLSSSDALIGVLGRPDAVEMIVPCGVPVIVPLAQVTPAPTSVAQSGAAAGEARCDLDPSSSYSPEVLSAPLRVSDVRMAPAHLSQQEEC